MGKHTTKITLRKLVLTILFALFLVPISAGDLSVNYSFVLLPITFSLVKRKVRRPPILLLQLSSLFILIFVVALLYQYQFYDDGLRRISSFVLFVSIFSYMFLSIDEDMVDSFKMALVAVSVLLIASSAYKFATLGGSSVLGYEAKNEIGSQRVGFIYLLALWITYLYRAPRAPQKAVKYSTILFLLVGIFMTFSKASIVGLIISFAAYFLVYFWKWVKRPSIKGVLTAAVIGVVLAILVVLVNVLVPDTLSYYGVTLFDPTHMSEDIGDTGSSAGERLVIYKEIFNFVLHNPLTGAGYLGVWILPDLPAGSAHSQYMDVLFRTGIAGFLAYALILYLLAKHLYRREQGLFWGFIGVLCYGLFHETFKESQGGFVLSFLIGLMSQGLFSNPSSDQIAASNHPSAPR